MDAERNRLHKNIKLLWFLPAGAALLFILVASMLVLHLSPGASFFGISSSNDFLILPLGAIIIAVLIYIWLGIVYQNFTYELDVRVLTIREGVFTRKTTVILYSTIQDITSERSVLERLFGLATLQIETAGSSRLVSQTSLPGIANKDEVIRDIMHRVARVKGTMGAETREQGVGTNQLLTGILDELKTISARLGAPGKGAMANNRKNSNVEKKPKSAYDSYENFKKN